MSLRQSLRMSAMNPSTVTSAEVFLDAEGHIALPAGTTLTSYLERNIADLGDELAYRYLDYSQDRDGHAIDLTWAQLGARVRAVAARLQQVCAPRDRVAICAPQGVDYVVAFFAAIEAGTIAVPLFAPELPGHTERLGAVLTDAAPTVVLTTTAAAESVQAFLRGRPRELRPRMIAVDAVPESVGGSYTPVALDTDDIAYLQYTSGSTRTPAGVEITHRGVCTNILQMAIGVGLDPSIRSVSWLLIRFMLVMVPIVFVLNGAMKHDWLEALLFAVAIAVGLTPEMLDCAEPAGRDLPRCLVAPSMWCLRQEDLDRLAGWPVKFISEEVVRATLRTRSATEAARAAGVSRRTIYYWIARLEAAAKEADAAPAEEG